MCKFAEVAMKIETARRFTNIGRGPTTTHWRACHLHQSVRALKGDVGVGVRAAWPPRTRQWRAARTNAKSTVHAIEQSPVPWYNSHGYDNNRTNEKKILAIRRHPIPLRGFRLPLGPTSAWFSQ